MQVIFWKMMQEGVPGGFHCNGAGTKAGLMTGLLTFVVLDRHSREERSGSSTTFPR